MTPIKQSVASKHASAMLDMVFSRGLDYKQSLFPLSTRENSLLHFYVRRVSSRV